MKKANIHGTDDPENHFMDMEKVLEKYGGAIPQIREIGFYFAKSVTGIEVVYQDDVNMPEELCFARN